MRTLSDLQDELGQWLFTCDCGDHQHGLLITQGDGGDVDLQIAYFPLDFRQRLRAAWRMLRFGVGGYDADIMTVAAHNVEALCHTIARASERGKGSRWIAS